MSDLRLQAYGPDIDTNPGSDDWNFRRVVAKSPITISFEEDGTNLVLSLCKDGFHRVAIDVDYPVELSTVFGRLVMHVDTQQSLVSRDVDRTTIWPPMSRDAEVVAVDVSDWGHIDVVPSSTPGHFHVYGDEPMTQREYFKVLNALRRQGVIGPGYFGASIERGFTALRKPDLTKPVREDRTVCGVGEW